MKQKTVLISVALLLVLAVAAIVFFTPPKPAEQAALDDEKYRAAYDNCVSFLKINFVDAARYDFSRVSVEPLPDAYDYCSTASGSNYYFDKSVEYWLIVIGDRAVGHNFALLVCDSRNNEVVGFIPIM